MFVYVVLVSCHIASYIYRYFYAMLGQWHTASSSAVENGVGPHDAYDLPRVVAVFIPHVTMEEIQVS